MWCSFEEEPLILRVYGRGKVLDKGTEGYTLALNEHFSAYEERIVRQIFDIDVLSVQKSCGWGVPFMILLNSVGERCLFNRLFIQAVFFWSIINNRI